MSSEIDLKIVKKVIKHYDLGLLVDEPLYLEGGFVNNNYKITTTKGVFLFKEFKKYISIEAIEYVKEKHESAFSEYLEESFKIEGLVGQPLYRLKDAKCQRIQVKIKSVDFK